MRASATRNTYAGPEPDSPVTASSCASEVTFTAPTLLSTSTAQLTSSAEAETPGATADAPEPTSAGVLGMARTTRVAAPSQRSREAVRTPAAIDSTRGGCRDPSAPAAASMSSGLVARTASTPACGASLTSVRG